MQSIAYAMSQVPKEVMSSIVAKGAGLNRYGVLGLGTTAEVIEPVVLDSLIGDAKKICMATEGFPFLAILTTDGKVYFTGGMNSYGTFAINYNGTPVDKLTVLTQSTLIGDDVEDIYLYVESMSAQNTLFIKKKDGTVYLTGYASLTGTNTDHWEPLFLNITDIINGWGNIALADYPLIFEKTDGYYMLSYSTVTQQYADVASKLPVPEGSKLKVCNNSGLGYVDDLGDGYCFGSYRHNFGVPLAGTNNFTWYKIPGVSNIKELYSGFAQVYYLLNNGDVYGCGTNQGQSYQELGVLGVGDTTSQKIASPTKLNMPSATKLFTDDTLMGGFAVCGTDLYAWGGNGVYTTDGALGVGRTGMISVPEKVVGIDASKVKDINYGHSSTFFLMEDGTIYSCGTSNYLLNGMTSTPTPTLCTISDVIQLIVGQEDVIYTKKMNEITISETKVAGVNQNGCLGIDGAYTAFGDFREVSFPCPLVDINCVMQYQSWALLNNGDAYFAGERGESSLRTWGREALPSPVADIINSAPFIYYLLENDDVWTRAANAEQAWSLTPTASYRLSKCAFKASEIKSIENIADWATLFVMKNGSSYMSGHFSDELAQAFRYPPQDTGIPTTAKKIGVGNLGILYIDASNNLYNKTSVGDSLIASDVVDFFTMVRSSTMFFKKSNGDMYAVYISTDISSTNNQYGTFGTGNTTALAPYTPVKMATLVNVVRLLCTQDDTAIHAEKSDGTWWAWGCNTNGQLGVSSLANQPTPVQVTTAFTRTMVKKFFSNGRLKIVLLTDGKIYYAGSADYYVGSTSTKYNALMGASTTTAMSFTLSTMTASVAFFDGWNALVSTKTTIPTTAVPKNPLVGYMQCSDYDMIPLVLDALPPYQIQPEPAQVRQSIPSGWHDLEFAPNCQYGSCGAYTTPHGDGYYVHALTRAYDPLLGYNAHELIYDTVTGTYSTRDYAPGAVSGNGIGRALNYKAVHVIGGNINTIIDLTTYTLSTGSMPSVAYNIMPVSCAGDAFYTFNKTPTASITGLVGTTYMFSEATGLWSEKLAGTPKYSAIVVCDYTASKILVALGRTETEAYVTTSNMYSPGTNTWAAAANSILNAYSSDMGGFFIGGDCHLVGGSMTSGGNPCMKYAYLSSSNYWYYPGLFTTGYTNYTEAIGLEDTYGIALGGSKSDVVNTKGAYIYSAGGSWAKPVLVNWSIPMTNGVYFNKATIGKVPVSDYDLTIPTTGVYVFTVTSTLYCYFEIRSLAGSVIAYNSSDPNVVSTSLAAGKYILRLKPDMCDVTTIIKMAITGSNDVVCTYASKIKGEITELPTMPLGTVTTIMDGMCGESIGTDIYSIGGCHQGTTAKVQTNPFNFTSWSYAPVMEKICRKFDTLTETWSTIKDSTYVKAYATSGVIDDKLYAAGGCSQSAVYVQQAYTEEYTPGTNLWATKLAMTSPRAGMGGSVYNSQLYCFGGCTITTKGVITATTLTSQYTPGTNLWANLLAYGTGYFKAGAIPNGPDIHVFGGRGALSYAQNSRLYSTTNNTWSDKTGLEYNYELNSIYHGALCRLNNKITAMGSLFEYARSYDEVTDTWSYVSDGYIQGITCMCLDQAQAVVNNIAYMFGGIKSFTAYDRSLATFDDCIRTIKYDINVNTGVPEVSTEVLEQNLEVYSMAKEFMSINDGLPVII